MQSTDPTKSRAISFAGQRAEASGLVTDLYQLTMAAGYWRHGMAQREAVFHLFFRRAPFGGSYALACGLASALDFLAAWRFAPEDLAYLETLRGNDGGPLFLTDFLDALGDLRFTCDLDAVPEGTVVFPHTPMVRVQGPLWQAQMVETALLTILNFQSLIATKASRVCRAAAGKPVLDFGLRRAQGLDGGHSASRACYVGGCVGTSNVWAARRFAIPAMGTHAHSWVLSFDGELEAFLAYAEAMPNNCTLLVDTYDTSRGLDRAIEAAATLKRRGHRLAGVRLDSGDLVDLSRLARQKLDAAGLHDAKVVASNDLDEHRIAALEAAGAAIDVWGVGTRLITGGGEGALGGVYKLAAIANQQGQLEDRIKISQDAIKSSLPGCQQVRRYRDQGRPVMDVIYEAGKELELDQPIRQRDGSPLATPDDAEVVDLLQPVLRRGRLAGSAPDLETIRQRAAEQLAALPQELTRLDDPEPYAIGMSADLYRRWQNGLCGQGP